MLVIQFDLDDTINLKVASDYAASVRWQDIRNGVAERLRTARKIPRMRPVQVALLAGCQSTDAWLCWGNEGGDPKKWEMTPRSEAKERLYGTPPRGAIIKSEAYVQNLLNRMATDPVWPGSLRFFAEQIKAAYLACQQA
jgi:hypothetical protein